MFGYRRNGFTLIELLIVLSIIALLLTIAAPRYFNSIDRSKETILKENLKVMRSMIDKFYGDNGRYPDTLDELVEKQYVRAVPQDPITESTTTWVLEASRDPELKGVYNVKSGGQGKARDGTPYGEL